MQKQKGEQETSRENLDHKTDTPPPRRHMLRTDEAPLLLRLLIELYGLFFGVLLYIPALLRFLLRVHFHGRENIPPHGAVIFCWWHGSLILGHYAFFPSYNWRLAGRPVGCMIHPAWIFHCMNRFINFYGVSRIASGTKGEAGHKAADILVKMLKEGTSVFVLPDGPVPGPPGKMKKGILHMALHSGAPILAVRITTTHHIRFRGWDRKFFPLPFSRLDVFFNPPQKVTETNFSEVEKNLTEAMG